MVVVVVVVVVVVDGDMEEEEEEAMGATLDLGVGHLYEGEGGHPTHAHDPGPLSATNPRDPIPGHTRVLHRGSPDSHILPLGLVPIPEKMVGGPVPGRVAVPHPQMMLGKGRTPPVTDSTVYFSCVSTFGYK